MTSHKTFNYVRPLCVRAGLALLEFISFAKPFLNPIIDTYDTNFHVGFESLFRQVLSVSEFYGVEEDYMLALIIIQHSLLK